MIVRLHPVALQELSQVAERYEANAGRDVAADFVRAYSETVELIKKHPQIGAPGPHATRKISLRRFPFSLVYRIEAGALLVVAIAHWRRRPKYWSTRV